MRLPDWLGLNNYSRRPVIAQDRPTSQDFSMPETSIKTGDVDFYSALERDRAQIDRAGWLRQKIKTSATAVNQTVNPVSTPVFQTDAVVPDF